MNLTIEDEGDTERRKRLGGFFGILLTARRAVFNGLSEGQLGNFERLANFHQKPLSKPDKPLASHGRQTVRFPTV
jgi:hypothetical protein